MSKGFFGENPGAVAGFRQGRREVLTAVYRYYVRPLDRYLRALARRSGASELCQPTLLSDLLQDVFLRAFSESARLAYDEEREYGAYLSAIARNCFIDALRARGREIVDHRDEVPFDMETEPPPEPMDPKIRAVLRTYLRDLPPPLLGIYEQRFVNGRSQDEASTALGLSRRQLRTGEERLRTGLRKALQRAGVLFGEFREPSVKIVRRVGG